MRLSLSRRLTTAVAVASLLGGCAHDAVVPVGGGEQPTVVESVTDREQPFCSAHEWLCIIAGLVVVGGVIAIIKGTGDDTSTDN